MSADAQRIDKWLWCARFAKSRSLGSRMVAVGAVRLTRNGATTRVEKPSTLVRAGDTLAFLLRDRLLVLRIERLAERRVSPAEASTLFRLLPGEKDDGGRRCAHEPGASSGRRLEPPGEAAN